MSLRTTIPGLNSGFIKKDAMAPSSGSKQFWAGVILKIGLAEFSFYVYVVISMF